MSRPLHCFVLLLQVLGLMTLRRHAPSSVKGAAGGEGGGRGAYNYYSSTRWTRFPALHTGLALVVLGACISMILSGMFAASCPSSSSCPSYCPSSSAAPSVLSRSGDDGGGEGGRGSAERGGGGDGALTRLSVAIAIG